MWSPGALSFKHLLHAMKLFANDESGVTSIEYALIGALIAVAILLGVSSVGTAVTGLYDFVALAVEAVMP